MDNAESKYKPLSLLLVEYKSGELTGFVLAWFSMVPIFFAISLLTLVVTRRDLTTIFYFFGFLLTEISNFVLKNLIKQPRPTSSRDKDSGSFSKYGMPSDHSQIMFYFSTFFILLVAFRYSISNNRFTQLMLKGFLIGGSILVAVLVAYSRVYLEYHTYQQIIVGSILGTFFGSLWFFAVHTFFSKHYYIIITSWKISEFLMIRDYTHIPNVLLFQYTAERNEANIRRKNKTN